LLVCSAGAEPSALAADGDDFDTKPVEFTRLIEKMETSLAKDSR
jgi:hypothetical protein